MSVTMNDGASPVVVAVGDNSTLIWGMTAAERLRRICAARKLRLGEAPYRAAREVLACLS